MAAVLLENAAKTLAEVVHDLGDIPLERIRFPVGSATEDDVIRLLDGDEKHVCELIDGVLVEKDMGVRESIIGVRCSRYIDAYLEDHDRGIVFGADGPVRLRRGRIRFPDTGFVAWERILDDDYLEQAILDAVPNLAIEVISKGNTPREMELKLHDYFRAGVQLVWYIYPKTQSALVYTSPTVKKEIPRDGSLDGGKVLPGFSLPLKKLFARTRRPSDGRRRGNGSR
jgi:Uma2 family endonuclease